MDAATIHLLPFADPLTHISNELAKDHEMTRKQRNRRARKAQPVVNLPETQPAEPTVKLSSTKIQVGDRVQLLRGDAHFPARCGTVIQCEYVASALHLRIRLDETRSGTRPVVSRLLADVRHLDPGMNRQPAAFVEDPRPTTLEFAPVEVPDTAGARLAPLVTCRYDGVKHTAWLSGKLKQRRRVEVRVRGDDLAGARWRQHKKTSAGA